MNTATQGSHLSLASSSLESALADSKLDEAKLRYEPVYIVPNTFVSHLSGYPHQFMLYWHIDLLALISDGLLACVLHLHEHIMSQ